MQVRSPQEAFYIACEMERSAVQLYSRAITLMEQLGRKDEPLYARLCQMLAEEQEHLRRFCDLYTGLDATSEQLLLLGAVAEGVLFQGGLMAAARQGLLRDPESMLRFAMNAETTSARKYREFAQLTDDEQARSTLLTIAAEEDRHLGDLALQAAQHA